MEIREERATLLCWSLFSVLIVLVPYDILMVVDIRLETVSGVLCLPLSLEPYSETLRTKQQESRFEIVLLWPLIRQTLKSAELKPGPT